MNTVSSICDQIGRKKMAATLGVGLTSISNASVANTFPTPWFKVVEKLCNEKGIECPDDLFNFKRAAQ